MISMIPYLLVKIILSVILDSSGSVALHIVQTIQYDSKPKEHLRTPETLEKESDSTHVAVKLLRTYEYDMIA